jgi:hypothetical protein
MKKTWKGKTTTEELNELWKAPHERAETINQRNRTNG